ncbi:hypothetical protein ISCGN_023078 [Ixodes scapularis]
MPQWLAGVRGAGGSSRCSCRGAGALQSAAKISGETWVALDSERGAGPLRTTSAKLPFDKKENRFLASGLFLLASGVTGGRKRGVRSSEETFLAGLGSTLVHRLQEEPEGDLVGTPVYEKQGPKWCIASPGGPRRVQTYPGLGSTTRMPFSPDTGKPRTAIRGRANPHGSGSVETPLSKHLLSQSAAKISRETWVALDSERGAGPLRTTSAKLPFDKKENRFLASGHAPGPTDHGPLKETEDPSGYLLQSRAMKPKPNTDGNQSLPPAGASHVDNAENLVGTGSRAEASLRVAPESHEDGAHVERDEPPKDGVPRPDAILGVLKSAGLVHPNADRLLDEVVELFHGCENSDSPSEASGDTTSSPSDSTPDNTSEEDDDQPQVTVNTSNQFAALLAAGSKDCNTLIEELHQKKRKDGKLTLENSLTGGKAAATRFNLRRNVMAVETTSAAMTHRLLGTDKLVSLPLHATLAPARAVSIGVIRGLCPNDATEKLTRGLESEVPVDHIRRFSGGRYAELFFGGPLPATVLIYNIEFVVEARHVRPTQCWGCGRFGHVQSACTLPTACPTCRGRHPRGKCATKLTPICPNCKCRRAAFDKGCSVYQQHKREAEAVRDTGCSWKEAKRVAAELHKKKASERSTQRAQEQTAAPPPWMHSGASQTPAWQTSVLPASSVWGDTFPTLEARSRPNAMSTTRELIPPVAPQPPQVKTREASTNTEPSAKIPEVGEPQRRKEVYRRSYRPDSQQQQRGVNDRRPADARHLRGSSSPRADDRPGGEKERPLPQQEMVPPSPPFPAASPGDSAGDSPRQDETDTPPTAQKMRDMIHNLEHLLQTLIPLFLKNRQATAMIPEGTLLHSITAGMQRCPLILQWNANGLGNRLTHLRAELLARPYEVVLLQEPRMDVSKVTIPSYTTYCCPGREKQPWAAVLVHKEATHCRIESADYCSDTSELVDSWGSDHIPITSGPAPRPPNRTCKVVHWDRYRAFLCQCEMGWPLDSQAIGAALKEATTSVSIPVERPNPDFRWLQLRAQRRQAQRVALRTGRHEDTLRYRRQDALFKRHGKRLAREQWKQKCESFDGPRGATKAWKMARTLCDRPGPRDPIAGMGLALNISDADVRELLADALLSPPPAPAARDAPPGWRDWKWHAKPQMTEGLGDFRLHELERALASLPRKKSAPGADGVTAAALRNLDKASYPALLELFNRAWRDANIPSEWRSAVVVLIPKPGKPRKDPSSFRPIALTSCMGKLLERMVKSRLEYHLESVGGYPESTCGFRRHHCTADAIADLVTTLEESKAKRWTTGVVLLDVSKAFDAVKHSAILDMLRLSGIEGRPLRYVRAYLSGREAQGMLLTLYKGLILSRALYALPLLTLTENQWELLERMQRTALRVCLGVPCTASSRHTLNDAGVTTVRLAAAEQAMRHLIRIGESRGTTGLPERILQRTRSQLAAHARELFRIAGGPGNNPTPPPPSEEPPLRVELNAGLDAPKRHMAETTARQHAEHHIHEHFLGWAKTFTDGCYTDGSVDPDARTATAAVVAADLGSSAAERLSFSSSTTDELAAMRLALSMAEAESPPGGLVLLSDSKAALTQLANLDRASPLGRVRELGDTDAAPRLDPGLPVAARPLRHRRK